MRLIFWLTDSEFFLTPIAVVPETAVKIVLASCVLHNFLRAESAHRYTPTGTCDIESIENGQIRPGEWRNEKIFLSHWNSREETDAQMQR